MVADDVLQLGRLHISFHVGQVEEALVAVGTGGNVGGRQAAVDVHSNQCRVDHDILGRAGMDVDAANAEHGGCGVEILILNAALHITVHRIGEVRAEAGNVKIVRSPSDLLVRRECNTDLSVRDILPQQALRHGHDFGDARLIVRSQQSRSVR